MEISQSSIPSHVELSLLELGSYIQFLELSLQQILGLGWPCAQEEKIKLLAQDREILSSALLMPDCRSGCERLP